MSPDATVDTSPASRRRGLREHALPLGWGFAEATLFFVVPDVLLTWRAVDRPRRGFAACGPALLGAIAGGAATWAWGRADPAGARAAMEVLPGIGAELVRSVRADLASHGLGALLLAPLRGVPYKLYALEQGAASGSLPAFLLASVPARLLRFLAVTGLAAAARAGPLRSVSLRARRALHLVAWSAFYAAYLAIMGG